MDFIICHFWDKDGRILICLATFIHVCLWLNQDPIGYQDGPNLYAYVHSNPINRADALGLCQADCDWFDPVEIKPWQQELIDTCIKRCEEDYGWWNPQQYACKWYCDNAATGTPDAVDNFSRNLSTVCPKIKAINENPAIICGCAVVQVLDFIPGIGKKKVVVASDMVCSTLSTMGSVCEANDNLNFANVLSAEVMLVLWGGGLGAEFTGVWSDLADLGIAGLQNMIAGNTTNPYDLQFDCLCELGDGIQDGWARAVEALAAAEYQLRSLLIPLYYGN